MITVEITAADGAIITLEFHAPERPTIPSYDRIDSTLTRALADRISGEIGRGILGQSGRTASY